jgi:hypothetical protein
MCVRPGPSWLAPNRGKQLESVIRHPGTTKVASLSRCNACAGLAIPGQSFAQGRQIAYAGDSAAAPRRMPPLRLTDSQITAIFAAGRPLAVQDRRRLPVSCRASWTPVMAMWRGRFAPCSGSISIRPSSMSAFSRTAEWRRRDR